MNVGSVQAGNDGVQWVPTGRLGGIKAGKLSLFGNSIVTPSSPQPLLNELTRALEPWHPLRHRHRHFQPHLQVSWRRNGTSVITSTI